MSQAINVINATCYHTLQLTIMHGDGKQCVLWPYSELTGNCSHNTTVAMIPLQSCNPTVVCGFFMEEMIEKYVG